MSGRCQLLSLPDAIIEQALSPCKHLFTKNRDRHRTTPNIKRTIGLRTHRGTDNESDN